MILPLIILMLGIVALQIYNTYAKAKWKAAYKDQRLLSQLIEGSRDVLYYLEVKPKLKFKYLSPSLDKVLGKGVVEKAFQNADGLFEKIHPEDYETLCRKITGEIDYNQIIIQRWRGDTGNYRWFEEYATPIYKNEEFIGVQGIIRNIDEKVNLQNELHYRISHDELTGIYNRTYFEKIMTELNDQKNVPVVIILCDLDELKYVNDHLGHKEGDRLLQDTAKLLDRFSSDTVTVSRIGGDEFVLLAADITENQVKQFVSNMHREIDHHNMIHSDNQIKMSIGFRYTACSMGKMNELFTQADESMYMDKMKRKKESVELLKL